MKDPAAFNEGYERDSEQRTTMSRRTYLQGLGVTSIIAGLAVSGTSPAAASTTSQLGYGEGRYGEFGYGSINSDQAGHAKLVICVENAEGEPVEDAELTIHSEPIKTAQTDSDGEVLVGLEKGNHNVEVSKDDCYRKAVIDVEAAGGGRVYSLIILEV
ncbi:hypothetical protein [Halalkalicoccus tibetensis]|uniref:Carboxypeptidase regulatory-like domain-containing protein n=1 Tax=Halalkalicoccus tibetensis TaxID=175632 RepID=A0ABD5V400_9EURY